MTPAGIFLLTILSFTYLATFPIFAQETSVTPSPTAASSPTPKPKTSLTPTPTIGTNLNITPTVTPKLTPPDETITPTPKQSPQPTSTPAPSPTETVQNTPGPIFAQSNEIIVTPTPTPQPVVLSHTIQTALPLGRIITAPFDLVTNYLPKNYYDDQGLTPQTNNLLLILSFLCISLGAGLLQWPSILKAKNHLLAPSSKKRHEFPIYSQKN